MTIEATKKLQKGEEVYYAEFYYEVAEVKQFPHGLMIGIYDEPPTKHIDYLNPKDVQEVFPCSYCQGGGCLHCGFWGKIYGF